MSFWKKELPRLLMCLLPVPMAWYMNLNLIEGTLFFIGCFLIIITRQLFDIKDLMEKKKK